MKSDEKNTKNKNHEKSDKKKKKPYVQVLKLCGVDGSEISKGLSEIPKKLKEIPVELRESDGEVHLYLTADTADEKEGKKSLKPLVRELKRRFGASIYATDEEKTLEMAVVELLAAQKLTLALAESCTGGLVSARIVNVPGASDVFCEGFVTYTDKAKRGRLLVKKGTLKKETAVSEKTAREMAKGGCHTSGADVCVSVTGYAGPDGDGKDKPAGTVFIGCCVKGDVTVRKYRFRGERNQVRRIAASYALAVLWERLLAQ